MAAKKSTKNATPHVRSAPIAKNAVAKNPEEEAVLMMYRCLSRWEKNAFHLLMNGLAWGQMVHEKTDHLPWDHVRRSLGLPAHTKEAAHG